MEWQCEVGRCKRLYVEWMNNKVLLYIAQGTILSIL